MSLTVCCVIFLNTFVCRGDEKSDVEEGGDADEPTEKDPLTSEVSKEP